MHAFIPIVALLSLAAAQSETSTDPTSTDSSAGALSTADCINNCAPGDVNCQAVCVNVPAPNESQILATNECSKNECTQGDSGPEDTKKYGECLASCASDFYYVSGGTPTGVASLNTAATGASTPANSSAESTTASDSSATSTASSSSESGSSDSSESSASSTASRSAASAASSASESASAESTGAATALALSNEMLTLSGGVLGLAMAALAL